MKCSHGIRYESRCEDCTKEALRAIRTGDHSPPPKEDAEKRAAFFQECYRKTIVPNVY